MFNYRLPVKTSKLMIRIFLFISFLTLASCKEKEINIARLNFEQFEPYLHSNSDSLYIINFWATWCAPCREELPALEKINKKYEDQKVKVLLVSVDFANQIQTKLIPFIKEQKLKSQILHLSDPDQNSWINKVDSNWSGSIPFTLIYKSDFFRESYEKVFQFHELDSIVKLNLKQP